jgi:osmoprotectant transport system ATP-binding protein
MPAAAEIVFDHVTKRYVGRDAAAVDDLSLEIPAGSFCVLVGPSGGGKTTALKMVNRLIPFDSGEIRIDGRDIEELPLTELRRGIGYVIQQIGLFPHMTIGENVATVPQLLGWDSTRIASRVDALLEQVDMDPARYRDRYPRELSGGQKQRVGVARALAADPPVMLMDEPFAAVDPIVRARLQDQFLDIQRRLRKTIVMVTHDVDEAIKMADRIAILNVGGILEQYAHPEEILRSPANAFVAGFVGEERGLRRLGLIAVRDIEIDARPRPAGAPIVRDDHTLREALDVLVTEGSTVGAVVGEDGEYRGTLSLERISSELGS